MTLNLYFEDGFHGTLTNENPQQIWKWLEIFSKPEVMKDCKIASLRVDIGNQNPLKEVA